MALAELNQQRPHATRRGLNEHVIAGVQPHHLFGAEPRRPPLRRQRRGDAGVHLLGNPYRGARIGDRAGGVTPETRQGDDSLPDAAGIDLRPDAVDPPDDLVAEECGQRRRIPIQAATSRHVGEIQTKGLDRDAHLSRSRVGCGDLTNLERLVRAAVLLQKDCLHVAQMIASYVNSKNGFLE